MSGGSYNYIYSRLLEECENRMYDAEMNDLINDLCEVLRDLEWWQSCDSSEEKYRATVEKFKAKWFKEDRTRLKGYIDETIEILKDLWRYEHSEYSEKDIRKALDIAIKALEKQIPQKPEYIADGYSDGELVYNIAKCCLLLDYIEVGTNKNEIKRILNFYSSEKEIPEEFKERVKRGIW